MSLKFCSPEKVPPEIKLYDNKISQMDVGKTGKIGKLLFQMLIVNQWIEITRIL